MVPDYRQQTVNVYLQENIEYEYFVDRLRECFSIVNVITTSPEDPYSAAKYRAEEKIAAYLEQYGIDSVEYAVSHNGEVIMKGSSAAYQILKITNWEEYLETQIGSFGMGMSALVALISIVSVILISLILYMTNKTIIIKRKTDFGILKAGGFESRHLIMQMAISFMPSSLIGSLVGCMLGSLTVNPAILAIFSAVGGVAVMELVISPAAIIIICLGIFSITMGITAFAALRVRNITAYQLISE